MIRALWHRFRGHEVDKGGWYYEAAPGWVCWTCEERLRRKNWMKRLWRVLP